MICKWSLNICCRHFQAQWMLRNVLWSHMKYSAGLLRSYTATGTSDCVGIIFLFHSADYSVHTAVESRLYEFYGGAEILVPSEILYHTKRTKYLCKSMGNAVMLICLHLKWFIYSCLATLVMCRLRVTAHCTALCAYSVTIDRGVADIFAGCRRSLLPVPVRLVFVGSPMCGLYAASHCFLCL